MTPARSFVATLFFAGPTFAQSRDLLPAHNTFPGVVTIPRKPVAGMRIDHADILNELLLAERSREIRLQHQSATHNICAGPDSRASCCGRLEIVSPVAIRLKTENRDIVWTVAAYHVGIRKNDTGFRFPRAPGRSGLTTRGGTRRRVLAEVTTSRSDHGEPKGWRVSRRARVPLDKWRARCRHEVWKSVEYKETVRYAADGPVLDA